MRTSLNDLKQLVSEDRYAVDDELVAEAIIVHIQRQRAGRACAVFPTDQPTPPRIRSFRRASHARSFRLARSRAHSSRIPLTQFG